MDSGASSSFIDTDAVPLNAQGDAQFNGDFRSSLPPVCSSDSEKTAFLIRIVKPSIFAGAWIIRGVIQKKHRAGNQNIARFSASRQRS
jgi:hypothetical protein